MSESTPSGSTHKLTARFGKLNPFKGKSRREEDDEDFGEDIDGTTVAGGGHSALDTVHHDLRVSDAVKVFLTRQEVVDPNDADSLASLLDKPVISPPSHVIDRSHPLPEYFISSSHNTYLKAHQLFGKSDAAAYETILKAGARCVEIDAWDNPDNQEEPKVTHGYTLVSNVPFRAVCEIIRDVVDYEATLPPVQGYGAAPILLSLENHCDPAGQLRLASIMREVFGDRLLSAAVRAKGHEEQSQEDPNTHVRLSDLGNKIAVIVEYHLPGEADSDSSSDSSSSSSSSEDEEERKAHDEYVAKKKAEPPTSKVIIPELAELGVYAQSVKPSDNSWYANGGALNNGPHHHLINVSEVGLASHVGSAESISGSAIAKHNSRHLMRVFPKGTRISSKNLTPVPFWSLGAQILALNWQSFGAPMQLNEALFAGTTGYVLKPAALRHGGDISSAPKPKRRLKLRIGGATDVPLPNGREVGSLKPYVTATLLQGNPSNLSVIKSKKKTGVYKRHGLKAALASLHGSEGLVSPTETDPLWDETLEWEYEDDELVFLRIFIKSDDSFSSNPILAVTAVRVLYVVQGWGFLRLLDLRGHPTACTLLVHFEVENL